MSVLIRPMKQSEHPLLEDFLYEAVFQEEGQPPLPRNIVRLPELRCYIENFGSKKEDAALCVEVEGRVVGAVWVRLMHAFGHVGDDIPELAIAVYGPYRRRGLGKSLMKAMLAHLQGTGCKGVSLSVQKHNPAAEMYLGLGFLITREHEREYVMEYRFASSRALRPCSEPCSSGDDHEFL